MHGQSEASYPLNVCWSGNVESGDVVRAHDLGGADGAAVAYTTITVIATEILED
jgi:hypothetical protein